MKDAMNKKINELHKQCWDNQTWHLDSEKFAKAIANECANICLEMAAKCAGLSNDGALAKDCAMWIKKDFGVEE